MSSRMLLRSPAPRVVAILLIAIGAAFGAAARRPAVVSAGQPVLASWTQLGPDGAAIARAIVDGPQCPEITLDGRVAPMQLRAAPAPPAFPVRVCERSLPSGTRIAAIEGQLLALPVLSPDEIVVIGDTGCRMQESEFGDKFQACNDPQAWPFAAIADRAASRRPELVIHVGDYHYREAPCPPGNAGCAGSPTGDTWDSWRADFFAPASLLLRSAPWVFVRGNHETCGRAGEGWFRFLDPRPMPAACTLYTEPYAVPLGDLQLLMLDSSHVDDYEVKPDQVAAYRRQFELLRAMATDKDWLLTHDPLWVFGHAGIENGRETLFRDNENLQEAAAGLLPDGLQLVLSGHIHLFETLDFGGSRAPQLVSGTGGTALDPPITTRLEGQEIDGMRVVEGSVRSTFGFLMTEPNAGGGWSVLLRGGRGEKLAVCGLRERRLRCSVMESGD